MRGQTDPVREPPAPAIGEAPNAGESWRTWLRNLAISAAAGVFLAVVGAMGTNDLPLLTRLLYWAPMMVGGAVLAGGIANVVARRFTRANPWVFGAALALLVAAPITFVVWGYTNLLLGADLGPADLPPLFGGVLAIAAAMTAIMLTVNRPGAVTHAPAPGAPPPQVRFLERLPAKLKGAVLYAVQSEDHYLRLHTSKGSDLILMRLADAVAELEGLEGAQVHRSWWVAREAVEGARRDGDRLWLSIKGGAEAPVSRPNLRPLREAGWF